MNITPPPCRAIEVVTFTGDHSKHFTATFRSALRAEKNGLGPGPSALDCLLYLGHAGISMDGCTTVYGFHADGTGLPTWQVLGRLRSGEAFPRVVLDDTAAFSAARNRGRALLSIEVVLPEPQFQGLEATLDAERRKSQYSYGFPDGDGDCNCVTWLDRLGLPLLTGRMTEFVRLSGICSDPSRRFGHCV